MTRFWCLLLISLSYLTGCNQSLSTPLTSSPTTSSNSPPSQLPTANDKTQIQTADRRNNNLPPSGHPRDFFPSEPGATWVYSVEVLGDDPPLKYEEVSWPISEGRAVTYATRGIIHKFDRPLEEGTESTNATKSYSLEMCVKGRAAQQGRLKYPLGVELKVLKDDLGIFENAKEVFWAITESGRFTVHLVITYDPDTPGAGAPVGGAFGRWGQGDGSSMRHIFFVDKPFVGIGAQGSPDSLGFFGVKKDAIGFDGTEAKGFEGTECLYFRRIVEAAKKLDAEAVTPEIPASADRLNSAFEEHMWYARGKGLVRLEQRVNKKPTMIWTLEEFRIGTRP
jgi:hypothetical protein